MIKEIMQGITVEETKVTLSHVMQPSDANPMGNVHGGTIIKLIDTAAGVVAWRYARNNAVTASIERLDFHNPVYIGDLLILKACLNYVGRTSMVIGVRAEAENLKNGEVSHTASAYLTFVAIDDDGAPVKVPPIILKTEEEKRRHLEAEIRKEQRVK